MEDNDSSTLTLSLEKNHTVSLPPAEELSFFFEFFLPGVLLNVIGTLGLVGNLFSIFILSRPQMKSSTNCILIGLATSDIILILTSILMFGLPSVYAYTRRHFAFYYWQIFPYITPFVYPIGLIAQTSSAYITLTVSVERYVAVCRPLKARSLCTYGRARGCVLIIGACAILYNLPRFFEVTWKGVYDAEANVSRTEVTMTWLRSNPTYISVYITWLYFVVMYIVPFSCLAAFNLRIYLQIRRANAERAQLSRLQQREICMATMLMIVVLAFFVCNALALVINVLEMLSISISELTQISNLLVTFNSSVNFIIYCIFGEKFKRLFCHLFCRRCTKAQGSHQQTESFQMLHKYTTNSLTPNGSRLHIRSPSDQPRIKRTKLFCAEEWERDPQQIPEGAQHLTMSLVEHHRSHGSSKKKESRRGYPCFSEKISEEARMESDEDDCEEVESIDIQVDHIVQVYKGMSDKADAKTKEEQPKRRAFILKRVSKKKSSNYVP